MSTCWGDPNPLSQHLELAAAALLDCDLVASVF